MRCHVGKIIPEANDGRKEMSVDTRRSFHLQEPPGGRTRGRACPRAVLDPRQSRAGTAARPPAALEPTTPGSAVIVPGRR